MTWHASLQLNYRREGERTVARHEHKGPLRVLQSLYPEGDAVCHNVLLHPPGGLVGGDTLDISVTVGDHAHGLITTPGATRFYRSEGDVALQRTTLTLAPTARLEWLPLEAICYTSCQAENHLTINLAPGAEIPADHRLMNSPLGLAGHRCLASLFFVAGTRVERGRRSGALDLARSVIASHSLRATAGATSPDGQVVVVRVLAPVVEPAMHLLRQVWTAWQSTFLAYFAIPPVYGPPSATILG